MQDLPVSPSEAESPLLTLRERFRAFNRQLASKCFSFGGVALLSFVLLFSGGDCDDGGDNGGDDSSTEDSTSGDNGGDDSSTEDSTSGDNDPGCDPPEDDDSSDDSDTDDGDSGDSTDDGYVDDSDDGDNSDDDSDGDLWEDSIFLEPRDKLQEEGVTSLPADPTKDTDKDVVTTIISEFDDTDGFKPKAAQDKLDELLGPDYEKGDPISREVLAEVMCAGLSCSGSDTDARINELYDMGITVGRYEHDGTDEGKANAFAGDETGSNGHVVAFFGRIKDLLESNTGNDDPGYQPPVYVAPPPGPGDPPSVCKAGYVVMAAYVTATDNGCRPAVCDFGRDADGWCVRPTVGDTPLLYLLGGGDVDEDGGSVGFKVVSTHPVPKPVTVTVDTTDGTAIGGSDYTTVSRDVTIPADSTFAFVFVSVLDDSISESDETFSLSMSSPTNADLSTTTQSEVTIIDDELPTPENVQLVCAGDSAPFTLTATWEGTPTGPLVGADEKVWFGRVNSDGTQSLVGWDFSPSGHTATTTVSQEARYGVAVEWQVGSGPDALRTRGVASAECGDVLDLFTVTCVSSTGTDISLRLNWDASLGSEDVYVFVTNYDLYFDVFHTYDDLAEGSTLTGFNWGTTSNPTGGAFVTFAQMRTPGTFYGDAFSGEPTEYEFSLPNQPDVADVSITIPGSSGDLSSVCPVPPEVSVADTTASEGDGVARFTVSLSAASPHLVTVEVDTSDGTATAPDDYTAIVSRTVTFVPGQTTATVSVAITDDTDDEPDTETFTVTISNPVNATLGTSTATGTITDDDGTGGSGDYGYGL